MELALLVLRVVIGLLFIGHGTQKLFGWWGGYGIAGTAGFMESLNLRPGRLHAITAGVAETAGGLLIALGLVTPVGSALITAVMVTAIITVHFKNGLWNPDGGYEFLLTVVAAAFALSGVGPGEWSLDNAFNIDMASTGWALIAAGAGLVGGIAAVLQGRAASRAAQTGGPEPTAA
jgi:putative oxidoreductase